VSGLELRLKTKALDDQYGADGSGHWRGSFDGSMHGEQRWDYEPAEGGTRVTADIDYTVPWSVLGKVADRLFVERMEERAIHQTLENLKFVVEH
jgi:coenzyme Q-binding protein COQ10